MKFVNGADYLNRLIAPFATVPGAGNSWADLIYPRRRNYIQQ